MKKSVSKEKTWHRKPGFGSLYTMNGSKYIYISLNYFKQRLRFPTDKEDTPQNWEQLCKFLGDVGHKIKNRTFHFAKTFYWLDEKTKAHFTMLEGGELKPEPEHVFFGEYAERWMERKISAFEISKKTYYSGSLRKRIIPYFENMSFASITAGVIESFIDNLKRIDGSDKPLSTKRVKNIIGPMTKVWESACNDYNWTLRNPFSCAPAKYKEMLDKELQEIERQAMLMDENDEGVTSTRDVFLFSEWQRLLSVVDRHYHPVMELLLMGMIGSELEALQKRDIKSKTILVRHAIVRDDGGIVHMKFKPKNWYRKRVIPLTGNLKSLMEMAASSSTSNRIIKFDNDIELPANAFLLTMKDGNPFNYELFRKSVWDNAFKKIELDRRVPYALRHTFAEWALLIGVSKPRLVDLMGHSTKKMVDERYGNYRQGLVDEREMILDYLGEDFLALEELRVYFPERYQKAMAIGDNSPKTLKAPALADTFGQSFGQSQGLYADNYL